MSHIKIITSEDGSSTLFNEHLLETYHSTKGAITESLHVYIKLGLSEIVKEISNINILEVGMGTGLNVLLTYQFSTKCNNLFLYHALEPYPLEKEIIQELNYEQQLNDVNTFGILKKIHESNWNENIHLKNNFNFYKSLSSIQNFESDTKYDIVYFDAFGPKKQPDIWNIEILINLFSMMSIKSCLVTYCSSGQFKRNLKEVGFKVYSFPGPPGKFEITKAVKG